MRQGLEPAVKCLIDGVLARRGLEAVGVLAAADATESQAG
jgi:hypothetical protein